VRQFNDWDDQATRPAAYSRHDRRDVAGEGSIQVLLRRWKIVLPGAILLAALILVVFPDSNPLEGSGSSSPAGQAQQGNVAAAPTGSGSQAPAAGTGPAAAQSANRPAQPAPTAAPTVVPTPTPSAIRPLAMPTMPPVENRPAPPVPKPGITDPSPTTDHVVVVDGASGAVLYGKNAFQPIAPASLTKIMTAILGLEYGVLDEPVKIDVVAATMTESTLMGLEPWFDVTMEDLLYGLMLPSGNDAALAIGRHVSGSDAAFAELMNQKAEWLGLQSTHFANPHGLDEPRHYSSPYDMVVMARYGMQYPKFREIVAAPRYDISRSNIAYTIYNLNPLLSALAEADGVKTGFTDDAGRALVGTAVRDGHRVYVAFMRSDAGTAYDGRLLLEWAFNSFIWPDD
jgi:D-alanyl-D-alanine carboxypeptidase